MHVTKQWKMSDWTRDIAAFERWKELYIKYGSAYALQRMQHIREKWPWQAKQLQIPELEK